VSAFFNNPEMLRNARIQLRPGRAIAAVVICAACAVQEMAKRLKHLHSRLPSGEDRTTGLVWRVQEMAQRPGRIHPRISSGEVM